MVNWEFFDNMTPDSARALVDDLRAGREVTPSRGAPRLCTFREASKILAGIPDGQANDGPQAGEATLAGLRIAHERGWSAPAAPARGDTASAGGHPRTPDGPEPPASPPAAAGADGGKGGQP